MTDNDFFSDRWIDPSSSSSEEEEEVNDNKLPKPVVEADVEKPRFKRTYVSKTGKTYTYLSKKEHDDDADEPWELDPLPPLEELRDATYEDLYVDPLEESGNVLRKPSKWEKREIGRAIVDLSENKEALERRKGYFADVQNPEAEAEKRLKQFPIPKKALHKQKAAKRAAAKRKPITDFPKAKYKVDKQEEVKPPKPKFEPRGSLCDNVNDEDNYQLMDYVYMKSMDVATFHNNWYSKLLSSRNNNLYPFSFYMIVQNVLFSSARIKTMIMEENSLIVICKFNDYDEQMQDKITQEWKDEKLQLLEENIVSNVAIDTYRCILYFNTDVTHTNRITICPDELEGFDHIRAKLVGMKYLFDL